MKNKIFHSAALLATLAALISSPGCKKYTSVEPVSQYSVAQAFSDPSNALTAVVGAYDELQGDNGYGIRISITPPIAFFLDTLRLGS